MGEHKTLKDIDVDGKRVLVRVDYNIKVKDGKIKDDTRIRESLDTINYLLEHNAKIIIIAHFGRPQEELAEGIPEEKVRKNSTLAPVASHLGKLINKKVKLAPDCVGPAVREIVEGMSNGEILMLENLRWHKEEEANDSLFSESLAKLCDAYVFDGFGVAHRAHASTVGVPLYLIRQGKPVAAGLLMDKELNLWRQAREKRGYKLLAIGGAKLEEKIKAVSKLHKAVNSVLVGGAVYNVIIAGRGINVGSSLISDGGVSYVKEGKKISDAANNLLLAEEAVIARAADYRDIKTIKIREGVPEGYMTTDLVIDGKLRKEIKKAEVIVWFGNLGLSDKEVGGKYPFAKGTEDFKKAISPKAYVIVGGGDSITASEGLSNRAISTGGGASIELYTKGTLNALEALKGNREHFKK